MLKPHQNLRWIPLVVAVLVATSACASASRYPYRDYRIDTQRLAYDTGYREGLERGRVDIRRGHRFDYERDAEFRRADLGYRRDYGNRDFYRRAFKDGFIAGYTEAFRGVRGRQDDRYWRR
jgi:hypothetical protein